MLDTVRGRIWARIRYQHIQTNCSNCAHSKDWSETGVGKCTVLSGLLFDIFKFGICKLHSAFNGGNVHKG
jgi:hypothetical protein